MDVSPWYLNKSKVRDEGTLQSFPFMPSAFKSNIMPIKNRRSQVLRYGRIVFFTRPRRLSAQPRLLEIGTLSLSLLQVLATQAKSSRAYYNNQIYTI